MVRALFCRAAPVLALLALLCAPVRPSVALSSDVPLPAGERAAQRRAHRTVPAGRFLGSQEVLWAEGTGFPKVPVGPERPHNCNMRHV